MVPYINMHIQNRIEEIQFLPEVEKHSQQNSSKLTISFGKNLRKSQPGQ